VKAEGLSDHMEVITGNKNETIKNISALLRSKKERDKQGVFVIEGLRIIKDTLATAPEYIEKVFVSESFAENDENRELIAKLRENTEQGGSKEKFLYRVKDSVFDSISQTMTPQGIMASVRKPEYKAEDILKAKTRDQKLLILENIQDPGNLGTIVRTAEAAGVSGILLSGDCADIYNPKVIRSTMGSVFRVPFLYCSDFYEKIKEIKANGIKIYAAYLHGGEDYNGVTYDDRSAIMIGNEGNGLTKEAVSIADKRVFIPMAGKIESLNAAVATAILLFHR